MLVINVQVQNANLASQSCTVYHSSRRLSLQSRRPFDTTFFSTWSKRSFYRSKLLVPLLLDGRYVSVEITARFPPLRSPARRRSDSRLNVRRPPRLQMLGMTLAHPTAVTDNTPRWRRVGMRYGLLCPLDRVNPAAGPRSAVAPPPREGSPGGPLRRSSGWCASTTRPSSVTVSPRRPKGTRLAPST
jgi:hypothetical protein